MDISSCQLQEDTIDAWMWSVRTKKGIHSLRRDCIHPNNLLQALDTKPLHSFLSLTKKMRTYLELYRPDSRLPSPKLPIILKGLKCLHHKKELTWQGRNKEESQVYSKERSSTSSRSVEKHLHVACDVSSPYIHQYIHHHIHDIQTKQELSTLWPSTVPASADLFVTRCNGQWLLPRRITKAPPKTEKCSSKKNDNFNSFNHRRPHFS